MRVCNVVVLCIHNGHMVSCAMCACVQELVVLDDRTQAMLTVNPHLIQVLLQQPQEDVSGEGRGSEEGGREEGEGRMEEAR